MTNYGYDPLSRQISISNTAIQGTPLLQKTYTPDGLLASLTDANNHATSFAYDGLDRLSTATYPLGSTEAFTYDADNNVTQRQTRAGADNQFHLRHAEPAFDQDAALANAGRHLQLRPGRPPDQPDRHHQRRDHTGSAARRIASAYAATYGYDVMNRPIGVSWSPAPRPPRPPPRSVTFGHSYNKANQRIGQTISDNSWIDYPAATPSTVSYTADALNRYTAVGARHPEL